MKKRLISISILIIMLLAFMPQTALAASHTVSDGQTLNLSTGELMQTDGTLVTTYTVNAGDTVTVAAGATATITGSNNVQISCDAGVTLTLDSVASNVSGTNQACALGFTGSGNTLILEGESTLSSGKMKAGVLVEGSTQLTIEGTGKLNARGGDWSAGIGAGIGDCGTLLIRGNVTIDARGGTNYGAGIGGAGNFSGGGSGGNITIESGTVTATGDGNNGSAGIGGGSAQSGYGGSGGNITIKGGTVKAMAGYYGAGIGGGGKSNSPNADGSGRGGVINISGGTVIAVGGKNNISGGGIGCGGLLHNDTADPYTELNITGGNVFVAGTTYDFYVEEDGEFNISNDAAVFLRHNSFAFGAQTTSHTRYGSRAADEDGYLFGIELPGWPSAGAYIVPRKVSYDLNGVDGTPISDAIIHSTGVVKIPTQDMTDYNDQELDNWNTQADGSGVGYTPGIFAKVADDVTLYAVWGAYAVSGVTLARDSLILSPGALAALEVNVSPGGAANASLSWTSSDTSVATVNSRGVVTAVNTGSALITAESENGLFDTCQVAVSHVLINYSLSTGSAMEMTAAVDPDATAVWTSDDETVATVDADGTVTAKAPGITMISVTAGGVSQTCGVVVYDQTVTSVKLSRTSAVLTVNDSLGLTAYVDPDDAVNKDVGWTSSDEDVATVNDSGTVTAVGGGSATITAQSGGQSASCSVTVTQPVSSVELGSSYKKLSLDETADLRAVVLPSDATDAEVTWTSSDESIVMVDSTGKVTAKDFGSVTVTAEADGQYDTCTVTVEKTDVTSVTLASASSTLKKWETTTLIATVIPGGATYPEVTWTSSDESIATVDNTGKVTAKDFGSVTVTAQADGVTAVCTVSVVKTDVTDVSLSETYKEMNVGDNMMLKASVAPGDSTYPEMTWTSSNTDIVTVDENGSVTAKAEGAAAIIADADGVYAVCTILVGDTSDDAYEDADDKDNVTTTATPTVTATPMPTDGVQIEDVQDTGEDSLAPTSTPDTVIITITVSDLPEGTTAVKLPDGSVIKLGSSDSIDIEVEAKQLSDNGSIELTALDDEGAPLGIYDVDRQVVTIADSASAGGVWRVLMWILVGIGGMGIIMLAAYLILKKRRGV